ncbi:hypothetical protein [Sulfurimonas sp. HSL3-7]|uniref:hypothetical protein n=1 Tax=Sulfonitrofixus jiaomeiensis TaxID=3131938 RepID=UPI0031FA03E5
MNDDKHKRRFRTLDELQEEYDQTSHSFKEELKDVVKNLKDELFSMWGLLILSALTLAILSAVVK